MTEAVDNSEENGRKKEKEYLLKNRIMESKIYWE